MILLPRRKLLSGAAALALLPRLFQSLPGQVYAQDTVVRHKAAAPAYTYPLDIQNGSAAFGLSLLRSAYAGSCLRVRRTSDNTEQDIGFTGTALDTTSLLSFCSGTNGLVAKWYDQSGNARHIVQAGSTRPQIVTSGALTATMNTHAVIDCNAQFLESTVDMQPNFITNDEATIFFVFSADTATLNDATPSNNSNLWGSAGAGWIGAAIKSGPVLQIYGYSGSYKTVTITIATTTNYVAVWKHTGGNISGYLNSQTASSSTTMGTLGLSTGVVSVGSNEIAALDGKLAAVLFYSASVSAGNLNSIGAALAAYYGITWS